MFSYKSIVILLSLIAFITGQQNGTEDYPDFNYAYLDENMTLPSAAAFLSDSLRFNDSSVHFNDSTIDETDMSSDAVFQSDSLHFSDSSLHSNDSTIKEPEMSTGQSTETSELLDATVTDTSVEELGPQEPNTEDTDETLDENINNANNWSDVTTDRNETRFSCYGRQFGQYADVDKQCRVYHMCYPFRDASSGQLLFQRITFLCDSYSVFDQQNLVCVQNSSLTHACVDSVQYYKQSNEDFLAGILNHMQAMLGQKPSGEEIDGRITDKPNTRLWRSIKN